MEEFKTCEEYVLVELEEKKALIRKGGCSWKLCRGHRLVQVQCPFASEGESLLFVLHRNAPGVLNSFHRVIHNYVNFLRGYPLYMVVRVCREGNTLFYSE